MSCCVSPYQARYLWTTSWLSLFSALYALRKAHYDLAPVPACIWITSIIYWWHPDYSWRRYLDMSAVIVGLIYQLIRARYAEHAILYYSVTALSLVFYPLGIIAANKRYMWLSVILHSMLHFGGNVANIVLYRQVLNVRTHTDEEHLSRVNI